VELSWFRQPGADHPGTLNLCYNAVDLQVVRGVADAPAVRSGAEELSFEVLLEQVAALAGAMRALGAGPETAVGVLLDDPTDRILLLLACLRLGAVHVELSASGAASEVDRHRPHLVATSRPLEYAAHAPAACLVRGVPVQDDRRDVDWEIATKAGRTDPAPCAELSPGSTAYVVAGREVTIAAATEDSSWAGRVCATLGAGRTMDVAVDLDEEDLA
jgi:non-ribosomal peptide synthetase component F